MSFLKSFINRSSSSSTSHRSQVAPPQWTPAPETPYPTGLFNEAPEDEYEAAKEFCTKYPPDPPRLFPSDAIDRINSAGCRAWGMEIPSTSRFLGSIQNPNTGDTKRQSEYGVVQVQTRRECDGVCQLSDLPIAAGLYDIKGKIGVYYEIVIWRMEGIIAIGTSCRPYPIWRFPGWNRLSAGFHLDDFRKFFEDPDGGRDYIPDNMLPSSSGLRRIVPGDSIGCGYEFASGMLFFTYNGVRLPPAFTGIYLPRSNYDVFAAVGVEGCCEFEVNFGGEVFRWVEGNEWAWRVEGHVGRFSARGNGSDDELPPYQM